jgi:hypothetical protein
MKLVVTGLSSRDEAAFGVFLGRFMPDWSWTRASADRHAVLPQADLFVVDMVSLGLAQWSPAAETDLLRILQGTPAVLLLPSHHRTWASMAVTAATHSMIWLTKPYGTKELQAALEKTAASVGRTIPSPVSPISAPRFTAAAPPAMLTPPSAPQPTAKAPAPLDESDGLAASELQTRLAALTEVGGQVFLRQLSDLLSRDTPFEVRFTVQNSLIVHPSDGWIATNTPMLVIERVCQSDTLASAVSVRDIDGAQAEERAQRLGMPPRELDVFLSDLVAATLDKPLAQPALAKPF